MFVTDCNGCGRYNKPCKHKEKIIKYVDSLQVSSTAMSNKHMLGTTSEVNGFKVHMRIETIKYLTSKCTNWIE